MSFNPNDVFDGTANKRAHSPARISQGPVNTVCVYAYKCTMNISWSRSQIYDSTTSQQQRLDQKNVCMFSRRSHL